MTPLQALQRARIGLGVAGGALVLGALMPWAEASGPLGVSFAVKGTDGSNDGWATLVCGAVVIGVVAMQTVRRRAVIAGLCGVIALAVGLYDWVDIRDQIDNAPGASPFVQGSVGKGLWLTLLAAVAVMGLSIWLYRLDRPSPRRGHLRRA